MSVLCSMVGASFVTVVAEVLRGKKSIQALGNAQIDTAQSKFGGSSALFDGTGDYLTVDNTGFLFQAGESVTMECWIRLASTASEYYGIMSMGSSRGASSNEYYVFLRSASETGNVHKVKVATDFADVIVGTTQILVNTWYHIAVVRNSNTYTLYVNGTAEGTNSGRTTDILGQNTGMKVGALADGSLVWNGHLDEIRVSKSARYTANFTAPTAPFVNDANTLLLIHANGTDASTFFEDDNGVRAPNGITAGGNAQIDTAQSKFGGSSALFDGTGDTLAIPYSSQFDFGNGNFTIEFWFRPSTLSGTRILFDQRPFGGQSTQPTIYTSGSTLFYFTNSANQITGSTLSTNTWYHITVSRSSTSTRMFVNGTQVGSTYSDSTNYTCGAGGIRIGSSSVYSGDYTNGWIDEVRVSNNARYTANFTAPTAPFVNDANTLLLIHCDGGDVLTAHTVFRDDNGVGRAAKSVVYRGNEQIDNAQSKFGGTSVYLDGQWDSPRVYMNGSWPSNLTIECWFRPTDVTDKFLWSTRTANNTLAAGEMQAYITAASKLQINLGSTVMTSTTTFATNTWYHVAVTKDGSSWKLWVNGTNEVSFTSAASVSGFDLIIGNSIEAFEFISYQGWIDEFRVSDTARYSATFTPATTAFQNDSNTVLLLHFDGTDGSNVFTDDNGVTPTHSYT